MEQNTNGNPDRPVNVRQMVVPIDQLRSDNTERRNRNKAST